MNPYVINRPEFDLVGSFNKGREASQNYQMNRQNMDINRQNLETSRYNLAEKKRLIDEEKKLKQLFGAVLKQSGGDVDKAQEIANQQFPNEAMLLNQGFAQLRNNMPDPMKRQSEQLNIDTKKQDIQTEKTNSFLSRFKPMVDELSAMTPEEQQASWPTFIKSMDAIGSGLPDHILEAGLTPESLQELQMVASGGGQQNIKYQKDVDENGNFISFNPSTGRMETVKSPEGETVKAYRAPQKVDLGDRWGWLDPTTMQIVKTEQKTVPIQETPGYKGRVAGAVAEATEGYKTVTIDGKPHKKNEYGDYTAVKYDKPIPVTSQEKFDALPIESQEKIKTLSTASARKQSIVNSMSGYLSEYDKALAKYQKSKSKTDYNDVIRIGSQALKTLNSPEGADAIGSEEAKRLGTALEFNWGNLVNPGAIIGRDLGGFSRQIKNTMGAISTGLKANDNYIKSLYKTSEQYDPETFFK